MSAPVPTEPGYYWAKLKTPSGGMLYGISGAPNGVQCDAEPETASTDWEIVQVNDNGGDDEDEKFSVYVFGVYPTQWPLDFFWGPKVEAGPPA